MVLAAGGLDKTGRESIRRVGEDLWHRPCTIAEALWVSVHMLSVAETGILRRGSVLRTSRESGASSVCCSSTRESARNVRKPFAQTSMDVQKATTNQSSAPLRLARSG